MFINDDCNWMNVVNDAIVTYTYNKHSAYNRAPSDASNNPEKIKYKQFSSEFRLRFKFGDSLRKADNRNMFSKGYTSNWDRELLRKMKF